MYRYTKKVELNDDVVHRYSLLEWEELMLKAHDVERGDLPLSYSKVAEIICWDLARYGHHWATDDDPLTQAKMSDSMEYTDSKGFTVNPRIERAGRSGQEANQSYSKPMEIGIAG